MSPPSPTKESVCDAEVFRVVPMAWHPGVHFYEAYSLVESLETMEL